MDEKPDNHEELLKLLALKRHEQPPPGFFDRLPGQITDHIRTDQDTRDANWLLRLFPFLEFRPAFAGVYAAGLCALLLGGIFVASNLKQGEKVFPTTAGQPGADPALGGNVLASDISLPPGALSSNQPPAGLFSPQLGSNQLQPAAFEKKN